MPNLSPLTSHFSPHPSAWLRNRDSGRDGVHTVSTNAYCADNPVRLVDMDGREIGDFIAGGVIIGNDGKNDGKLYVVNNRALSTKSYRQTKTFIKQNSGNSEAFANNQIAYQNSTQIDACEENRQAMIDIVSQDNGQGETCPANNREYGWKYDDNGKIIQMPPEEVGDLTKEDQLKYDSENIFHSHASGTWTTPYDLNNPNTIIGETTERKCWVQEPSQADINNCGDRIRYVFGMRNRTVYVYNKKGIQATIPIRSFVHPQKK